MTNQTLISVIVPVYKVERYLPKCVESILNQTYSHLEIILVDDGSPDGSGAICDALAQKDDRIRVIHKENGGLSDARNAGIQAARGEYLAFVDSDDWIEPDTYEAMLGLTEKYGVKLVCAGRYDENDATGETALGLCPQREEVLSSTEVVRRIFRWDGLDSSACDKLFRRELFRDIRFPVGQVVEDVPTIYRVVLLAEKGAMLPKPLYHYVHREQSITTASFSEKSFYAVQNAARVYNDIRQSRPELEPDARYLLTKSQEYVVQTLALEDRATREKYDREYRELRRTLRGQIGFALGYDRFSPYNRFILTLTALGLFPAAVKTGRFLKKLRRRL